MLQLIQIIGLPFLACVIIGAMLGYLGIHVLKREVIFIDIALAQIAAVGSILAHLIFEAHDDSVLAYICSFCCVLLAAGFYAAVRKRIKQISLEAVIGVSYAIAAGAALFLVGIAPGGHLHVQTMLSGSLLWATWQDIIVSMILFFMVGLGFLILRKPLGRISENYQDAVAEGVKVVWWDFLFYTLLGVVITFAVRIAGVVAVFALLIIPATISAFLSSHWLMRMIIAWAAIVIASVAGLLFAYYLDFSVGPSVVLFLCCELVITSLMARLKTLILGQKGQITLLSLIFK